MPHTHDKTGVGKLNIRCGVNEGLCVLNRNPRVDYLYTDSLIGCAQVIWRGATATFCAHILDGARDAPGYILWALDEFNREYSRRPGICYVISGDNPSLANSVYDTLKRGLNRDCKLIRQEKWDGMAIRVLDGSTIRTPRTWSIGNANVGGWLTSNREIDLRLRGSRSIGEHSPGDYLETCRECNRLTA